MGLTIEELELRLDLVGIQLAELAKIRNELDQVLSDWEARLD